MPELRAWVQSGVKMPGRIFGEFPEHQLGFWHAHANPFPETPVVTYVGEGVCLPGYRLPSDSHANLELTFVRKGRGRWRLERDTLDIQEGFIYAIRPGEVHSADMDSRQPFHWYSVCITPDLLPLPKLETEKVLRKCEAFGSHYFESIFRRILRELDRPPVNPLEHELRLAMVKALLVELLVQVLRVRQHDLLDFSHVTRSEFRELLEWVILRPDRLPTIEEMAERVYLSPAHFGAVFRAQTGFTPSEFLLQLRIRMACRYLSSGENVTQVAYRVGCSSSQYFATQFKRIMGCTPTAWRSSQRTD